MIWKHGALGMDRVTFEVGIGICSAEHLVRPLFMLTKERGRGRDDNILTVKVDVSPSYRAAALDMSHVAFEMGIDICSPKCFVRQLVMVGRGKISAKGVE